MSDTQSALPVYAVVIVTLGIAIIIILLALLWRQRRQTSAAGEHSSQLEQEVSELRDAGAGFERDLAVERVKSARLAPLEADLAQQRRELGEAREAASAQLQAVREEKARLDSQLAEKTALLSEKAGTVEAVREELIQATAALLEERRQTGRQREALATLQETLDQERRSAAEKLQLLVEAKEAMTKEFKVLANEVMAQHGESFSKQNKEQIDVVLQPLRDKLTEFQLGLQTAHTESVKDRVALGVQIRQLSEASSRMTSETTNLTRALKGSAQTQGAWGEMILGTILERSGLREGAEYVVQASHATEEGQRLRPDVIVNLPGRQHVIIDAKVSLVAFEGYVNSEVEEERQTCLGRHIDSMRSHIKDLSGKEYQSLAGGGLDYVVMFVPIEGALAAALQRDPELTNYAVQNNVAIATPTTLMIALRTVESVWQVERRNANAEEIADRAGKMYAKFVGFVDDLKAVGSRLTQAQTAYQGAFAKLSTGQGNLARQFEQMKELGARTGKSLPRALLGDESDEVTTVTEVVTVASSVTVRESARREDTSESVASG